MRSWPGVSVGVGIIALVFALSACRDSSGPEPIDRVDITNLQGEAVTEVRRGEVLRLRATAFRGQAEVPEARFEWSSADLGIATVDTLGRVEGLDFGTAVIRATPIDLLGQAGEVSLQVVGAPIAQLEIQPDPAFVDVDDVVEFSVVGTDENGQVVTGAEVEWSLSGSNAELVSGGEVRGLSPGAFELTVTAWNGVEASVNGRVTPVTQIGPQSGLWGQDLTISGESLPADARVYFTGSDGLVPAFIQESSASEYRVWVPVFAASGPITVAAPADSFNTSRSFTLTAQDDIYRNASEDALEIELPFHNPSLAIRAEPKFLFFEVENPTPVSLFLGDRGDPSGASAATALFLRFNQEGRVDAVTTWLIPIDFVQGVWLNNAIYSREELSPGLWGVFIEKIDFVENGADPLRPFEMRLTTETNFELPPDDYEPNDFAREAPLVELPFEAALNAENGHRVDNFVIDVEEESTLEVTATGVDGELVLYLFSGDEDGLFLAEALELNFAGEDDDRFPRVLTATVAAGRYTVVVREFGGQATPYDLEITAEPVPQALADARPADARPTVRAPDRATLSPARGRFAGFPRELPPLRERLRPLPRR